jgi:hypothetical protein
MVHQSFKILTVVMQAITRLVNAAVAFFRRHLDEMDFGVWCKMTWNVLSSVRVLGKAFLECIG